MHEIISDVYFSLLHAEAVSREDVSTKCANTAAVYTTFATVLALVLGTVFWLWHLKAGKGIELFIFDSGINTACFTDKILYVVEVVNPQSFTGLWIHRLLQYRYSYLF